VLCLNEICYTFTHCVAYISSRDPVTNNIFYAKHTFSFKAASSNLLFHTQSCPFGRRDDTSWYRQDTERDIGAVNKLGISGDVTAGVSLTLFLPVLVPTHKHLPASLHGPRNPKYHHFHRRENPKSLIGAAQSVKTILLREYFGYSLKWTRVSSSVSVVAAAPQLRKQEHNFSLFMKIYMRWCYLQDNINKWLPLAALVGRRMYIFWLHDQYKC
jgi:hypothetical protein